MIEVSHYVAALEYGLKRLREFPLSLRLIEEIHGVLLAKGRGSDKQPGEFRTSGRNLNTSESLTTDAH